MMSYGVTGLGTVWCLVYTGRVGDGITLPGPALHINYIKTKINIGWKFALSIEFGIIYREIER